MKKTIWREMFSGTNGMLSSKRIMGAISYFIILGCIIFLVVNEGATMTVADLLQTLMFMAAALLGLDSVTGIWKNKMPPPTDNKETKKGID